MSSCVSKLEQIDDRSIVQKIKKIIFDNDGVNIDSEHVAMGDMAEFGFALVSQYVDPETVRLTEKDIFVEYKGQSSDVIKELIGKFDLPERAIRNDYGVPADADLYEFLSDLHTKSVIEKFEKGPVETLPGVADTWKIIRDKFGAGNIALCTTSRGDRMDASVHAVDPETKENVNWGEMFPNDGNLRVSGYGCGDEYDNNKYKYFRALNPDFNPEETVVVEDTAGSTKKAIDACFHNVIGIVASKFQCLDDDGNPDPKKQAVEIANLLKAGAPIVVTDYRDIPSAIEWMENGMDMNNVPVFSRPPYTQESLRSGSDIAPVLQP